MGGNSSEEEEEERDDEMEGLDESILKANAAATEELDEEDEQEERERELERERTKQLSAKAKAQHKKEALSKLETLLQQASQYTDFLAGQLIEVQGGAGGDGGAGGEEKRPKLDQEELLQQPSSMTGGTLKPYQLQGFRWLTGLWENGLNGVLADEMGLGKTVQTLALMCHLRQLKVFGFRLIVAPLSTISNWVSECERWCPDMPCILYHGSKEERSALIKSSLRKKGDKIPLVITTYEIVCRDRKELQKLKFSFLVVDEGHRLKNRHCKLIKELNLLVGTKDAIHGGCSKLLLTGTPLQNDLSELWSLLNFLLPQVFSNLDFFQSVFEFDSNQVVDATKVVTLQTEENIVGKLHKILRPFMLRRLKSQVESEMPPKREVVLYCAMTPEQRELYDSIKRGELAELLKSANTTNKSYLNLCMQLRKASNHPYLHFDPTSSHTDDSIVQVSGKMVVLDRMLRELKARGHKVLLFSQFTSMLDIVDDYLRFLRPEYEYCRLDGNTHYLERRELMKNFNDPQGEAFLFLLSTRAGGVGINLASADTVIIFDSDWNPHQDSQAQDRAHRIGQTKPVAVYRLVTGRSIELSILSRANSKRKLERVVVQSTKKDLSSDDLRTLLQDDFTGHMSDIGEVDMDTLDELLDREKFFAPGFPKKGKGYEVAEHQASSIVGAVNDDDE
ncbi:hypothetical protein BASA81_007537 [Batrachochytrium salamandrivorans]|nr:hypothetical protein BASA81_007537 [Batrachochytrium salamandrivorans]